MKMNVHLNFSGNCADAFQFYQKVFRTKDSITVKYSEAPHAMPVEPNWREKIMHTSIPLGDGSLMGCDAPHDRSTPLGGFQVSVEPADEAETRRIFEGLKEGGSVQMPMSPTFWSPMFGMCTDKFGVAWMVGMPAAGQP